MDFHVEHLERRSGIRGVGSGGGGGGGGGQESGV